MNTVNRIFLTSSSSRYCSSLIASGCGSACIAREFCDIKSIRYFLNQNNLAASSAKTAAFPAHV